MKCYYIAIILSFLLYRPGNTAECSLLFNTSENPVSLLIEEAENIVRYHIQIRRSLSLTASFNKENQRYFSNLQRLAGETIDPRLIELWKKPDCLFSTLQVEYLKQQSSAAIPAAINDTEKQ